MRFSAGREAMRGLALSYALKADISAQADRQTHCALTQLDMPLLQPGSYVLASPQRDGSTANLWAFHHNDEMSAPLQARFGQARNFDYLAFRISEIV